MQRSSRLTVRAVPIAPALLALAFLGCAAGPAAPPAAPSSEAADSSEGGKQLLARGQEALQRGDSIRAEQYLSLALEQGAPRQKVVPLLLRVCLTNSRLRAALNYAEPYLREHPDDDALRYLVATVQLSLGQEHEARKQLDILVYRNPRFADSYYLLGVLDFPRPDDAARVAFSKYLALAPHGEHAAEVESRLSELAVREQLAKRSELTLVDRPRYEDSNAESSSGEGGSK